MDPDPRETPWHKRTRAQRQAIYQQREAQRKDTLAKRVPSVDKTTPVRVSTTRSKTKPLAKHGPLRLTTATIEHRGKHETHLLPGVTARIESGEALQKRVTLTRAMTVGILSLAAKKKSGGEWWLTIEGENFLWTEEVDRKKQKQAHEFAAKVNDAARKATTTS